MSKDAVAVDESVVSPLSVVLSRNAAPMQEQAGGEEGLAATVGQVRRCLTHVLTQGGAPNPVAHVLAARVEELGSSRRRDERMREHLMQVTPRRTALNCDSHFASLNKMDS